MVKYSIVQILEVLVKFLFLTQNGEKWDEKRVKSSGSRSGEDIQLMNTFKRNQSFMKDPHFSILDESSSEEEDESYMDHSRRVERSMVDGGTNSPCMEFHVQSWKKKMDRAMSGATNEGLKEQAQKEATIKNIPIKNTFATGNEYTRGNSCG